VQGLNRLSYRSLVLMRSWQAVSIMFFLNGALFGAWASRIPAIAARYSLDTASLGLLLLALAFGAIVSFPLAGAYSEKLGAGRLTRLLAVAYALSMLMIPLAATVPVLALAIVVFGATHGAMDVAMNAWASEVERDLKTSAMSGFHAMFSLGAGLGAATGYLAVRLDATVLVQFTTVALCVLSAALFIAGAPTGKSQPPSVPRSPSTLFALPRGAIILVGLVAFGTSLGEGAMADWSAIYMVMVASSDPAIAALGYAIFSIVMVTFRLMGDRIVTQLGAVATVRFSAFASLLGVVLAVAGATPTWSLAGFALMGAGYAIVMPLVFSRAANDPNIAPGPAIAGVAMFGYGGMLAGPPVIGFVAELTGLRMAFALLGCLALLSAGFAGHLKIHPTALSE